MDLLSGKNWSGNLLKNKTLTASGRVNGYAWYFQVKTNSWLVEIAEDQAIDASDLPLVGFGCGGWLYECDKSILAENGQEQLSAIRESLSLAFTKFQDNELQYLPAVTCACSE